MILRCHFRLGNVFAAFILYHIGKYLYIERVKTDRYEACTHNGPFVVTLSINECHEAVNTDEWAAPFVYQHPVYANE